MISKIHPGDVHKVQAVHDEQPQQQGVELVVGSHSNIEHNDCAHGHRNDQWQLVHNQQPHKTSTEILYCGSHELLPHWNAKVRTDLMLLEVALFVKRTINERIRHADYVNTAYSFGKCYFRNI